MKGTVIAESGKTVKLRKEASTKCSIYWDIPIGTELEIVDQREKWSKCICGGLTGWMKNEFIETGGLSAENRTRTADASVSRTARGSAAPDPLRGEDIFDDNEPDSDEALTLLAEVYGILKDLCERILGTIGKG